MKRKLKAYHCEKCNKKFIPIALDQSNGVCNECIDHNNRLDYIKGLVLAIAIFIVSGSFIVLMATIFKWWMLAAIPLAMLLYRVFAVFRNGGYAS